MQNDISGYSAAYILCQNGVLHRDNEERNVLHKIKRRKANWIGQVLRGNCLGKHVIEEKIE